MKTYVTDQFRSGCLCKDVQPQMYRNQVAMKPPFELTDCLGKKKTVQLVCVDTCLATEIAWLWKHGIVTMGCCCGHGESEMAMINVADKSIEQMEQLGYEHHSHEKNPDASRFTFVPKSI